MRRSRKALALAALLALSGCAARETPLSALAAVRVAPPAAAAHVARDGDRWTVEYRFAHSSPVWAFTRSPLPRDGAPSWRVGTWTVETPGVRLERRGRYDILTAAEGPVPPVVRVRFVPFGGGVTNSYDPALLFTDGSVALFDGQFALFPVTSAAAAEALPHDLRDLPGGGSKTKVGFRDVRGRVLYAGARRKSVSLEGTDTYVLFGPAEPVVTKDMAAIVDPAIPAWLRAFLNRSVPELIARYSATLGPPPGPKPTIIVNWAGATPETISMSGSVLRGLVLMTFEGVGVLQERAELSSYARWFVAHEAAHFWLGQAVRYGHTREQWITEGGADLLAIRTVQALDPAYDSKAKLNESVAECAKLSKGRGVAGAAERREHQAHYACGALFGLLVEQRSGQPFTSFVRALLDANRADGVVTRTDWLALARERGGDPALIGWIETMLDHGFADPEAAIAAELKRAGINVEHREGEPPRLI